MRMRVVQIGSPMRVLRMGVTFLGLLWRFRFCRRLRRHGRGGVRAVRVCVPFIGPAVRVRVRNDRAASRYRAQREEEEEDDGEEAGRGGFHRGRSCVARETRG